MDELKNRYFDEIVPELISRTQQYAFLASIAKDCGQRWPVRTSASRSSDQSMGEQLAQITGQKAKVAAARKSIAAFRLRQGDPIGLVVTLRGERMYQFLNKVIRIVLPRLKDFQGRAH